MRNASGNSRPVTRSELDPSKEEAATYEDSWIDSLGRTIYTTDAAADQGALPLVGAPTQLASSMPPGPPGSPWAAASAKAVPRPPPRYSTAPNANEDSDEGSSCHCCGINIEMHLRNNNCYHGLLSRLGLVESNSNGREREMGSYYRMKNNHLTKIVAHMRNVWVFVGFYVLLMLVMVPLWNANRLLLDPSFAFFAGKNIPRGMLSVCVSIPILYTCTVSLIFKRGSLQAITEQTMLAAVLAFIALLGLAFLLLSIPISYHAASTYDDIARDCTTSDKSRELFQTSQALQYLKQSEACAGMISVTQCPGYTDTTYAAVLKDFEFEYSCSGYCYQTAPPSVPTLLQISAVSGGPGHKRVSLRQKRLAGSSATPLSAEHHFTQQHAGVGDPYKPKALTVTDEHFERASEMKKASSELSKLDDDATPTASERLRHFASALRMKRKATDEDEVIPNISEEIVGTQVAAFDGGDMANFIAMNTPPLYAPTLFSNMNWQASCDGASANFMRSGAGDIAVQTFYYGISLMALTIIVGFMTLLGACAPKAAGLTQ